MVLSKNRFLSFKDSVFVVTGSSMGIGRELARQILQHGGYVLLNGRTKSRLDETTHFLCNEFGNKRVAAFCGDISQAKQAKALITTCIQRFGRLHFLINKLSLPERPIQFLSERT